MATDVTAARIRSKFDPVMSTLRKLGQHCYDVAKLIYGLLITTLISNSAHTVRQLPFSLY